ncbi:hypothetical protein RHGRI_018136 [Rhododendron griersonianum]|uniref:Pectinesterase inhibitor domain-containing protein n=1 Tax=Rhododendron griersonianum TaxID=479676 RepID=A0AAV6K0B1_9ERIC|nr:hypothetical protein RHGRI_018136 [Rhododendron griersonianum]
MSSVSLQSLFILLCFLAFHGQCSEARYLQTSKVLFRSVYTFGDSFVDPGNSHLRVIFRLTVKIYPTRRFSRTRISGNRRPLENLPVETLPEKSLLYSGKLLLNGVVLEVQHTTWVWEITRGHTWPPTWISMSHLTYRNKVFFLDGFSFASAFTQWLVISILNQVIWLEQSVPELSTMICAYRFSNPILVQQPQMLKASDRSQSMRVKPRLTRPSILLALSLINSTPAASLLKDVYQTCTRNYETDISKLETAKNLLSSPNYKSASALATDATTNILSCDTTFILSPEPDASAILSFLDLTKKSEDLARIIEIILVDFLV